MNPIYLLITMIKYYIAKLNSIFYKKQEPLTKYHSWNQHPQKKAN